MYDCPSSAPAAFGRRNQGVGVFRWSAVAALAFSSVAAAAPWLPPGSFAVRHDLLLLADAGVIHAPVMTWPISWADIAREALVADPSAVRDSNVLEALIRVQRLARQATRSGV